MIYTIKVHEEFAKELSELSKPIKEQLRKKLDKVVQNPHIPKNRLGGGLAGCYKVKLKKAGIRLVYKVDDGEICILLITVGKRSDNEVYETVIQRLSS